MTLDPQHTGRERTASLQEKSSSLEGMCSLKGKCLAQNWPNLTPVCSMSTVSKVAPGSLDGDISKHTHPYRDKVISCKSNEARFVSKFALLHTSADLSNAAGNYSGVGRKGGDVMEQQSTDNIIKILMTGAVW